jgi:phage-related tail protein
MKEEYQSLQNEAEELDEKLADVRGAGAKQVSSEDIQQVEKAIQKYIGTWKSRKRSFKNVWSHVSENFDGNQKALFEDLGIDEDGEMELMKIEEAVNNKKRKALS